MDEILDLFADFLELEAIWHFGVGGILFIAGIGIAIGGYTMDYNFLDEITMFAGVMITVLGAGIGIFRALN